MKFKAKHNRTDKVVEFEFDNLGFAKYNNPCFIEWEEVE